MRSEQEIKDKADELYGKAKSEFLRQRIEVCHKNCKYNSSVFIKGHGRINYCMLKSLVLINNTSANIFVCDSDSNVSTCKSYKNDVTEESAAREFANVVSNPSLCGKLFPKLFCIMWVMNEMPAKEQVEEMKEKSAIEKKDKGVSFWSKLLEVVKKKLRL